MTNINATTDADAELLASDTLLTMTDGRGAFRMANLAFLQRCGFNWSDLEGQAASTLRHPDMPAAVYAHVWDQLKSGAPVAAFIKYQTVDRSHFWGVTCFGVMGDGGFVAVTQRPTARHLGQIKPIYTALREAELREGVAPKDSLSTLQSDVAKLGYRSYDAFMIDVLDAGIAERSAAGGHRASYTLPILAQVLEGCRKIDSHGADMLRSYRAITVAPTNLQVRASRLGDLGQALASISANFTTLTTEMTGKMNSFTELSCQTIDAVNASRFGVICKRMMADGARATQQDCALDEGPNPAAFLALMEAKIADHDPAISKSNEDVGASLAQFERIVQDVRQLLSGLSVMRTMSQMEAARLVNEDPSIEMIVNDLRVFHDEALHRLDGIVGLLRGCDKDLLGLSDVTQKLADGGLTASTDLSSVVMVDSEAPSATAAA